MRTLGIREVRQRYQILKETLDAEGEVILTHHGKPFARVLPMQPVHPRKRWQPHAELDDIPYQPVPSEYYLDGNGGGNGGGGNGGDGDGGNGGDGGDGARG